MTAHDAQKPAHDKALDRKIRLQRLAMMWERVWAAAHWPLIVTGIQIIVIASGVLTWLPPSVGLAALVALAVAGLAAWWPLVRLALPTTFAAMRRMEAEAQVPHRPLSSISDAVAPELDTPEARSLWEEHLRRQQEKVQALHISPPRSAWRDFDPRALRVPVALGVVASLALGSGSFSEVFSDAAAPPPAEIAATVSLDAWLRPPAYTGKPPLLLTSRAFQDRLATGEDILVPENAVLTVRATGATEPRIEFHAAGGEISAASLLKDVPAKTAKTPSGFTAESKLTRPVVVRMMDGAEEMARWPITVVPDAPPSIAVADPYTVETGGSLTIAWEAKDDYGVRSITSELELADEQADGIGFTGNGPFLFDAPQFPVRMKRANQKAENGKATHDLTAHPWAGLNVMLTLTAKDAAGNTTASTPLLVKLPERTFTRPLAKALIEQRKRLVIEPAEASAVADLFEAILLYPKGLVQRSALQIRLAAITSRLANATGNDDVIATIADMWQLALDIEDGTFADAKAELRDLKKQLEQALRNGASEEEIAKLMDKMRDAMNRYMDALRKEAEKNMKAGKDQKGPQGNEQMVTREDLQRMLDMIDKLNKDGNKDQAQALLDQLDRMLQNLQPGGQQQMGEQGNQLGEMLDQLSEMMREQQRLMDETQRMPGPGEPGQQGEPGQGQQGQGQEGEGDGRELSRRQGALGDMLDRMMEELGGNAPGSLGEAGKEMRGAQGSLGDSDREGALQRQGNALDQLRKGAGELRRQMREGQGQARNNGRDGPAGGRDDDPLGRPRATRNPDEGPDKDMVPSELAAKRAREILEQLRARANERGLTDQERGYIDRLLRGLY